MKSRPFLPGCVALDVNSMAIHSCHARSAHSGLQDGAATPASGEPLEFAAAPLPGEEIHRFHFSRYG
jgi:hypothetical protein